MPSALQYAYTPKAFHIAKVEKFPIQNIKKQKIVSKFYGHRMRSPVACTMQRHYSRGKKNQEKSDEEVIYFLSIFAPSKFRPKNIIKL